MTDKNLLILDDEPDFAAYLGRVAESLGFAVKILSDPLEFQNCYRALRPDVIIMDVVMPSKTGIQLVEWLVSVNNEARVVLVTGYNPHFAEAAQVFAHAKGRFPVSVLTKPTPIAALSAALTGVEASQS